MCYDDEDTTYTPDLDAAVLPPLRTAISEAVKCSINAALPDLKERIEGQVQSLNLNPFIDEEIRRILEGEGLPSLVRSALLERLRQEILSFEKESGLLGRIQSTAREIAEAFFEVQGGLQPPRYPVNSAS
jgi:hypothetical protein